jgi:hypothetical protein
MNRSHPCFLNNKPFRHGMLNSRLSEPFHTFGSDFSFCRSGLTSELITD